MTIKTIPAILAAVATAVLLSACGTATKDAPTDPTASDTAVINAAPAGFDADDVTFATNMIPHHQQAVELAAMAPDRTKNPQLLELASRISGAQQPEIDTMRAFLVQWNENPQDSSGHEGHGNMKDHGNMAGMVDDATMAKLQTLQGAQFDTLWLQSMIAHHQGAIEMAKAELADGQNVDAKTLAQQIITAQQGEIDQMQKMLAGNP